MISASTGEALAFATLSVKGSTQGTVTNESGRYELKIAEGAYTLVVKYLGYKSQEIPVVVKGDAKRDIQLEPEDLELPDVLITENGEDPAYAIIRRAIERREQNDMPFDAWKFHQYSRTTLRYQAERDTTVPAFLVKGMMGAKPEDTVGMNDKGIAYLEETISDVAFRQPDVKKEKITSSRISGNREQYGFVSNMFIRYLDFNPYRPFLTLGELVERGIVSPLSPSALFFYDYKLLGIGRERGLTFYKIRILPKRASDPVMSGEIYITDSLYAVKAMDVYLTKENQIQYFDSLHINQEFIPVNDSIWAPFKIRYEGNLRMDFVIVKVALRAAFLGVASDYRIGEGPEKPKPNEIITFGDSALARDSAWWNRIRPVPLDTDEAEDFRTKDSTIAITESPAYMDSVAKGSRKFKPVRFIFSGYHPSWPGRKFSMDFPSGISMPGFDPMEGFYLHFKPEIRKEFKKERTIWINPELRYGFAANLPGWKLALRFRPSLLHHENFNIHGGDLVQEISSFNQIPNLINLGYTLFLKENFMKLYRRQWIGLSWRREWLNGLSATLSGGYENRLSLPVVTDYSWSKITDPYPANYPVANNKLCWLGIQFTYHPGNKYLKLPDQKLNLGSDWPTFEASLRKAIPGIMGSEVSYLRWKAGIRHELSLRLLGHLRYEAEAGGFLNQSATGLQDYFHFQGNQTIFRTQDVSQFSLMPYYSWSTSGTFIQAHGEQAFGGWILNKLPLIRKLRFSEYAGIHYLWTTSLGHYMEFNAGLSRKFFKDLILIRADFHYKITGAYGRQWGVTFTLPSLSGNFSAR